MAVNSIRGKNRKNRTSVTSDSELTLCTDYVTTTFQNGRKVTSLPRKRNHTLYVPVNTLCLAVIGYKSHLFGKFMWVQTCSGQNSFLSIYLPAASLSLLESISFFFFVAGHT